MAKADIDFEKELWNAANELRGAVSENNYKNYILPLVFLKHLSERYEMVHEELTELLHDPKSDYYTIDKEEISYVLDDADEYRSRNTFKIPKTASWQHLKDNAEQDDIKVIVDDAFDVIQELLTAFNPQLNNLLPRIFVKSELSAKQTGGIINLLSHPKFSEKENPESDILGRIYEYYIGRFAMAEGSGAGQFFTPGSIVRLLVEILEPYKGRIFDPACGSGGMFVQSLKFVKEHAKCAVLVSGRGNNFLYVDEHANWKQTIEVILNAKTDKISACNALDKILVNKNIPDYLNKIQELNSILKENHVKVLVDDKTKVILNEEKLIDDTSIWYQEFLEMKCCIGTVDSVFEAIDKINEYSGGHSATIMTTNNHVGKTFMEQVDCAVVYQNASTRFTDGGQIGVGAELAISTDKLHHRGPLGLKELVTNKYYVFGDGHVRV